MRSLRRWWFNELPAEVKFVLLVLLANGLPAFVILMSLPGETKNLFIWTINPEINARLVGVMYGNALLLVALGMIQTEWARVRVIMVVITLFSVLATLLTFFYLDPFRAHPWFHFAYWLSMYGVLLVAAPYVFVSQERRSGGRLPVRVPLTSAARLMATASALISLACGLALLFMVGEVNDVWPWKLPPLVGGMIGVLLVAHAAAYGWGLWDGDWLRVRPIFWQSPPTGLLLVLLPVAHSSDLHADTGTALPAYYAVIAFVALGNLAVILSYRRSEQRLAADGH